MEKLTRASRELTQIELPKLSTYQTAPSPESTKISDRSNGQRQQVELERVVRKPVETDQVLVIMILAAVIASITSFVYFWQQGLTTAFGDSEARLLIARQVIDSVNPGLGQLGGIWPPLPQMAMLPFVWNDTLYQTGLAGSIFPMISFVLAVIFLYKLIVLYTRNRFSGVVGVVAFSSPNSLFMTSVPMSEMPFIGFALMTVYYLAKWVKDPDKFQPLLLCAVGIFFSTLIRYEGWLLFWVVLAVIGVVFWSSELERDQKEGFGLAFIFISLTGTVGWMAFNFVYFGDPLYFMRSEFAPWAIVSRALEGMNPSENPTGDIRQSFDIYLRTVIDNAGIITSFLAGIGAILWLVSKKNLSSKLVPMVLLFPFPFFVVQIYLGESVALWHPDYVEGGNWGTRYGTLMLPAVGFFVGYLTKDWAWIKFPVINQGIKIPVLAAVIVSSVLVWQGGIISSGEAYNNKYNPRAEGQNMAADWIGGEYDHGLILVQRFANEHLLFESRLPLGAIIYEGSGNIWKEALDNPQNADIDWIIATKPNGRGDMVSESINESKLGGYERVYQENDITIYKRIALVSTDP